MFWGCYVASSTGCLESIQGVMKSQDYQGFLEKNVWLSVRKAWSSFAVCETSFRIMTPENKVRHTQEWLRTNFGRF